VTDRFIDQIAERAMAALKSDDPEKAARTLHRLLAEAPERLDLLHALAVTELRRADPGTAWQITLHAQQLAERVRDDRAAMIMPQLVMVRAAALEDLLDGEGAADAYRLLLEHEPENPRALQGLGHVLLGAGRLDEGLATFDRYIADQQDEASYIEGAQAFVAAVRRFVQDDIHPEELLKAHRGSYVEMFDHYAAQMAQKGWVAEAARMTREDDGRVVPMIPEGARPYAALRVDLVDPQSGQPGRIGEQPMVVALAGFEPLSQAAVAFAWPERDWPFAVYVSSQCPWNDLVVQVRFADPGPDDVDALDGIVGDWYAAGFDGRFGDAQSGRFHEVSDIEPAGPGGLRVSVDAGRAQLSAVHDLLRRLVVLHGQRPLRAVLFGRGFVPA
jgi:hypothetical protein